MQVKLLYTLIICTTMTFVFAEPNNDSDISDYQDSDYFESPEYANSEEEDNASVEPYFPAEYQAKNYRVLYDQAEAEDGADPTPRYEDDNYNNENAQAFDDSDMMEDANDFYDSSSGNSDLVDQA